MTKRWIAAIAPIVLAACSGGGAGGNESNAVPVAAASPPAGQKWTDVVSITPEGGFRQGNPDAPVKLVEYGSRTCPACGAFGQNGQQPLEDKYVSTGKVSYEFRDFLIHAPDLGVALLGRCAGPAPFFPILHQMYTEQPAFLDKLANVPADFQQRLQGQSPAQQAAAWVDHLGYIDFMKQRGVPEQQLRQCLADPQKIEALAKVSQDATQNGVTGTPTFYVNGDQVEGAVGWPQVEQALKAAGA